MIFEVGTYRLDVDVEKNREFYKNAQQITDGCSCDGCRNYFMAAELMPQEVKAFFEMLRIDCKKAAEIIAWCSENNRKALYYGGFYHLCGTLLTGDDCWKENGENENNQIYSIDNNRMYSIIDGYSVGFSNQTALVEKDFPTPVIQMEIDFHNVPWVLEEENTY